MIDEDFLEEEVVVKTANKKKRAEKDRIREELRQILNTSAGRYFYWRILEKCNIFSQTFAGEFPLHNAFREGQRSIGIDLWKELFELDPRLYAIMESEAQERKRESK